MASELCVRLVVDLAALNLSSNVLNVHIHLNAFGINWLARWVRGALSQMGTCFIIVNHKSIKLLGIRKSLLFGKWHFRITYRFRAHSIAFQNAAEEFYPFVLEHTIERKKESISLHTIWVFCHGKFTYIFSLSFRCCCCCFGAVEWNCQRKHLLNSIISTHKMCYSLYPLCGEVIFNCRILFLFIFSESFLFFCRWFVFNLCYILRSTTVSHNWR